MERKFGSGQCDLCGTLSVSFAVLYCTGSRCNISMFCRTIHDCCAHLISPRRTNEKKSCSWFFTYNFLSEKIPKRDTKLEELGRRAFLGFCSSAISDTCSNSIRVVKVYKQSHPEQLSYPQVVQRVLAESGVQGLLFRGLETKILANGLQGILFSVLWKQFEEVLFPKHK